MPKLKATGDGRQVAGHASRGVVAEIDEKLAAIDQRLEGYRELVSERQRLIAARAALTGESPGVRGRGEITQDDVAAYLADHPGLRATAISQALGASLAAVSSHLSRGGKRGRFERKDDGWHLAKRPP